MAQPSTTLRVCIGLSVVMLGFSGYGVVVRLFAAKNSADPILFCLFRDIGAFIVMTMATVAKEGRLKVIRLSEIPLFFFLGLTGVFGNQYLYIMAVYDAGVDIATLFSPCVPVITCMLAISCRIEKMPSLTTLQGCMKMAGIAATVLGALVILLPKYSVGPSVSPANKTVELGALCSLLGNACTAVYILCQKRYLFDCNSRWSEIPLSVTVWSYFFGAILMAVPSLYSLISCSLPWVSCGVVQHASFPHQAVVPLIYAIFITSALCYMLLSWCNKNASPLLVSAFYPVQIPGAVFLAYIFLDEQLGFLDCVGGGLITIGLMLAIYSDWHEKHEVTHIALYSQAGNELT